MAEITINESGKRAMQDAIKHLQIKYGERFDVAVQHTTTKGHLCFVISKLTDTMVFELGEAFNFYKDISLQEREVQ